jgi:hypothetical protein
LTNLGLVGLPAQAAYATACGVKAVDETFCGNQTGKLFTKVKTLCQKVPGTRKVEFLKNAAYDFLTGQSEEMREENSKALNNNLNSFRTQTVDGVGIALAVGMNMAFFYFLLQLARKNTTFNNYVTKLPNVGGMFAHTFHNLSKDFANKFLVDKTKSFPGIIKKFNSIHSNYQSGRHLRYYK